MDLKNLNVAEMNSQELLEVEGGFLIPVLIIICILAGTFMAH